MPADISLILGAVLEDYALSWGGNHGVAHWARVYENGLRLFIRLADSTKISSTPSPAITVIPGGHF